LALLNAREKASTQQLKRHHFRVAARLNRYENTAVQATSGIELDLAQDGAREISPKSTTWRCSWKTSRVADRPDALDLVVSFRLATGAVSNCAAVVELEFENWSTANYVCLPSAVYNGNRFHVQPTRYPPMIDRANRRPDLPIIINDFPRLNIGAGESVLQQPGVSFRCRRVGKTLLHPRRSGRCNHRWPRRCFASPRLRIVLRSD